MKLGFFRSKITKEDLEKQAMEELEAAMARAKPPTDAERTWVLSETSSTGQRTARSVQDEVGDGPAEPDPAAYGPGVVIEDEPYGPGVVVEEEPIGEAAAYGPGVVLEDEPLTPKESWVEPEVDGEDQLDEFAEVEAAPVRRARTAAAPSRSRTAPARSADGTRAGKASSAKPSTRTRATAGETTGSRPARKTAATAKSTGTRSKGTASAPPARKTAGKARKA